MARREVDEIASDLISFYEEKFGGKTKGRYKISKANLAYLSARVNIQIDGFITPLIKEMLNHGFSLTRSIDEEVEEYIIIRCKIFTNYREVPLRLIRQYLNAAEQRGED